MNNAQIIEAKSQTIEDLKRENEQLKARIAELADDYKTEKDNIDGQLILTMSFPPLDFWDLPVAIDWEDIQDDPYPYIKNLDCACLSYGEDWGLIDLTKAMNDEQKAYCLNRINERLNKPDICQDMEDRAEERWLDYQQNGDY